MSRSDQMTLLAECRGGQLAERIAEQERIITALNGEIAQLGLRIDENAAIIDANNQEIARIVSINGQLIIRRAEVQTETASLNEEAAASRARQEEMLLEAERILQNLATS